MANLFLFVKCHNWFFSHRFINSVLTLNIFHGPNNVVCSDLISRSLTDWFKPITERSIAPVQHWCNPIVQYVALMQGPNEKYYAVMFTFFAGTKTHCFLFFQSCSLYSSKSHSYIVWVSGDPGTGSGGEPKYPRPFSHWLLSNGTADFMPWLTKIKLNTFTENVQFVHQSCPRELFS